MRIKRYGTTMGHGTFGARGFHSEAKRIHKRARARHDRRLSRTLCEEQAE